MEKEITRTLLGVFLCGSLGLLAALPRTPGDVQVLTRDKSTIGDSLFANEVYDLRVADTMRYALSDSLSWWIEGPVPRSGMLHMDIRVKRHVFEEPGVYMVGAYKNLREIARDTLFVSLGEGIDLVPPDDLEDTTGAIFSLRDGSRQTTSTAWSIRKADGDSVIERSNEKDFDWSADLPGQYWAQLMVETRSGQVLRDSIMLTATVPAPRPVFVQEAAPIVPPKPRPSEPRVRTHTPPPAPVATNTAFLPDRNLPLLIRVPTEPPDRKVVTFKSQATRFEISPRSNCRLHKVSYFSSGDIGKVQVKIECITPACTGEKILVREFVAGYDAYTTHTHEFKNMPVLNKGCKYRMTMTPLKGKLGYFEVEKNKFREVKEDGRTVMINGTSIKILDEETCVYNLIFQSDE